MKFVDGWWVPDIMDAAGSYVGRAQDLHEIVKRVGKRRVVVQAGGHIGVYPSLLARYFESVYTFEPELENFRCLVRNAPDQNIFAARGVLAGNPGPIGLRVHSKSTGGHSVGGLGRILVIRQQG